MNLFLRLPMSFYKKIEIGKYQIKRDSILATTECFSQECGFLSFSRTHFDYHVSFGFHIKKGILKMSDIELRFENEQLVIYASGELLIKVKCDRAFFHKVSQFNLISI